MTLRRLTAGGLQQFHVFLDSLRAASPEAAEVPIALLTDPQASAPIPIDVELQARSFATRFELAEYLESTLTSAQLDDVGRDVGLWAWIALYYFDQLCPLESGGRRNPGERARWIPDVDNYRKYYRHLVAGPYRVYRAHRDDPSRVRAVLAGSLDKPGEIFEQLASHQSLITNRGAMALVTALYFSHKTGRPKRGAAGQRGGSARRLVDVFNQYDLTWDLYAMSVEDMFALLPREFDRFRDGMS